jgi:UDP-2-acetamido-2,6-beta-L-arabino-hexul-4-ose reductase
MPVTVEPLPAFRDPRGSVCEPLAPEALPCQRNVHLVLSVPGAIRGNHLHRHGTEVMVVHGPALVRYREGSRVVDHTVAEGDIVRFVFPPGVAHAVQNTGRVPQLIVSFNTAAHDPAAPDVVREVLISPS